MKKKHLIAGIIVSVMLVAILTACGVEKAGNGQPGGMTDPGEIEATSEDVKEKEDGKTQNSGNGTKGPEGSEGAAGETTEEDKSQDAENSEQDQQQSDQQESNPSENAGKETSLTAGSIEEDIPDLRAAVASEEGLGETAVIGACLGMRGAEDENLMALVTKHFNAVTLENELKPETLFGNMNDSIPADSIRQEEVGGSSISVPTLHYEKAEKILDQILAWNNAHPDHKIRIRGHVLVWHSQTPEWFFHAGYDKNKEYATKEEMDKRQEWYIKSVLEHFTGESSKYKDLFYGWDVVNEAVSDGTGDYRTDTENGSDKMTDSVHSSKSSWWRVYGDASYIASAFRYANKYAPADLRLYYNDYNECDDRKAKGILKLIADVKAAEGTRIDGFGMQGHYNLGAPNAEKIEEMARQYADAAGSVMLTELDVKASPQFDGSEGGHAEEYNKQAAYYHSIYEAFKAMRSNGVAADGITLWGVIDTYSWLQDAAGVGGGADGKKKQVPLLFDGEYHAKPAYWAFVDPTKVNVPMVTIERETMIIHKGSVKIGEEVDDRWETVKPCELSITTGDTNVSCQAKLLWDENNLYVLMDVKDPVLNDAAKEEYEQDSVEIFIDENHAGSQSYDADDKQYRISFQNKQSFNGEKCKAENITSYVQETEEGYLVTAAIRWTDLKPKARIQIGIELQVNDAGEDGKRKGTLSLADDTGTCFANPSMMGHGKLID
ncbi:MAG: endo-1,4-beta-xylanase [Lachnospiraceae bacterium]|nr:endo-1,4-beta-xylanase [Lachnospiraceae bacterium]